MKRSILLWLVLLCWSVAKAQSVATIDGFKYLLYSSEKEATLMPNNYSGDIIVPEKVTYNNNTYTVVAFTDECFANCTSLTSVVIPSSVTSLPSSCFSCCYNLTNVVIPSSVTSLGSSCFSCCYTLKSVEIPSSVTSLGERCFYSCSSLTNVELPSSVTSIGKECFSACTALEYIKCRRVTPPTTGSHVFRGVPPKTCFIFVPAESINRYKSQYPWNGFTYIMKLDDDESTTIGNNHPLTKARQKW